MNLAASVKVILYDRLDRRQAGRDAREGDKAAL